MSWMKAITDANYDMLRIAVDDLRQRVKDAQAAADAHKGVSPHRVTFSTRNSESPSNIQKGPVAAVAAIRVKVAEPKPPPAPAPYQPDAVIQLQASAALSALSTSAPPEAPPRRVNGNGQSSGSTRQSPKPLPRYLSSPALRKAKSVKQSQRAVAEFPTPASLAVPGINRRSRSTSTPDVRDTMPQLAEN